jgi:hypothetical protein
LSETYKQTDGGTLALYELGLLKISMWRQQGESNAELKQQYLDQARAALAKFIESYPNSFLAVQVRKNLDSLPAK